MANKECQMRASSAAAAAAAEGRLGGGKIRPSSSAKGSDDGDGGDGGSNLQSFRLHTAIPSLPTATPGRRASRLSVDAPIPFIVKTEGDGWRTKRSALLGRW